MTPNARFKAELAAGRPLLGTFVKTPHATVVEILGAMGLDFLVLDGEHSPFDRAATDACLLAARAAGVAMLVRVPDHSPSTILGVLDCGAAGVVVPHVTTREQAVALADAVRYVPGGRGIAGTTRAGQYGLRPLAEHRRAAIAEVSLICQIEDREGVENHAAIAAVDGVDGLFVGRADLSLSYGRDDFSSPEIDAIAAEVLAAKGAATGLYCAPGEDLARFAAHGASFVVSGSDHTFLIGGARALAAGFAPLRNSAGEPQ
jgi:2-keto-3-deoxy-L-rhamnonate aldolase RhmA